MPNEELIAALEAADGPSRELDAEVAKAFGIFSSQDEEWNTYWMPPEGLFSSIIWRKKIRGAGYECPRFTSSIDAALMLVPDEIEWAAGTTVTGIGFCNLDFGAAIYAATPALAIVIAALKAGGEG